MCFCIARRTKISFYNIAIEINDHYFFRSQLFIRNTAGLDGKNAEFSVGHAYISECEQYKSQGGKLHVGFVTFFFDVLVLTHMKSSEEQGTWSSEVRSKRRFFMKYFLLHYSMFLALHSSFGFLSASLKYCIFYSATCIARFFLYPEYN